MNEETTFDQLAAWPPTLTLKFRAWHPAANQFYLVYQLEFDMHTGLLSAVHLVDPKNQHCLFTDACNVRLQQFVGFVDRHGTEVYDGDIVKATLSDHFGDKVREVVEQVVIQEGFLAPFYMRVNYEEDWWKDNLVDGFEGE